jgi:two-component system sensor histidine kinase KdpD
MPDQQRPTADALLARIKEQDRARLRIYVGAAPGVGKTYEMLQEAHALRARGLDVVVGYVEAYGRRETEAQIKDLEVIPRRSIEYRGVTMEEMDVDRRSAWSTSWRTPTCRAAETRNGTKTYWRSSMPGFT